MSVKVLLWIGIFAVAGLGAGVVGGRWYERQQQSISPGESDSVNATNSRRVHALGRLEPHTRIVEVGATAGTRLIRLTVTEGDVVSQGSVIAHLNAYEEREAARDHAAAQLAEAQQLLAVETKAGEAAVDLAKLNQQHVREVLPLQIDALQADLKRAAVDWEDARSKLKRTAEAAKSKTITPSEYDDALFAAKRAEQIHRSAEITLEQLTRDRELKLKIADVELRQAEAAKTKQELATRIESLKAALALAEAHFEQTVVYAPVEGQILEVLTREGEGVSGPILKMGDTARMQVRAEVYETDIRHLKLGQPVKVTSRTFNDALTGKIIHIGSLIHRNDIFNVDPTANVDARVVEVRVVLDDSTTAAKYVQHQVDVAIDVDATSDAEPLSREP